MRGAKLIGLAIGTAGVVVADVSLAIAERGLRLCSPPERKGVVNVVIRGNTERLREQIDSCQEELAKRGRHGC